VILAGYVQHGLCLAAIGLYITMVEEGGKPNEVVFAHTLNACGGMGATKEGKLIHSQIFESCLESDLLVGNSILKMYVQFGLIDDAFKVFENLSFRDIMSWSTMIEVCMLHGEHSLVHRFLEELQQQSLKPDE
jgi:pentatricopeptide repeat protein